jgi:hypothetical protein
MKKTLFVNYRPDFLHENNQQDVKICEINARFVLNAYLMTYFGYNIINECAEMKKVVEKNKDFDLESIKEIGAIDRIYEQIFDTSKPIGILKFKEVSVFKLFFLFLKELN